MKALLATTLVATLLLVAELPGRSSSERARAAIDDPPPVECPLCGGNVRVHFLIVATLTATQAEVGRRALVALF